MTAVLLRHQLPLQAALQHYEREQDPFYVWFAYRFCRAEGIPLPAWVLRYLDEAADAVIDHGGVEALLPQRRRGRRLSRAAQAEKACRDLCLALHVQEEINRDTSQVVAWETVAEAEGVSPETVRNAWRTHRAAAAWIRERLDRT